MDTIFPIFTWWLALQVISLVGMPFTILLFRRFPLHGYPLNKSVSVLLVGYTSWLLAMVGLGPFNSVSVILALFLIGGIGLWVSRWNDVRRIFPLLQRRWRSILVFELLFVFLLLVGLGLRGYGAVGGAIFGTEKPMDLTFLSAILESPSFPPQDPWLAGYAINYYYLGYVLVSTVAVIAQVMVGTAFNLGIATIFALTALMAVGLIMAMSNSVRRIISVSQYLTTAFASLLGILMVLIIGNQAGALQVLFGSPKIVALDSRQFIDAVSQRLTGEEIIQIVPAIQTSDFGIIDSLEPSSGPFNWWWPSRAVWDTLEGAGEVPGTVRRGYAITEFPFFSFYLADLHPHVLALPFGLLAMALAFEVISSRKPPTFFGDKKQWLRLVLTSIILGSLYFINSWDAPIYALIYLGSLVLSWRCHHLTHPQTDLIQCTIRTFVLLAIGCLLVVAPFIFTFQNFAGGSLLEPWASLPVINMIGKLLALSRGHTSWYAFLSIFGVSCVALLAYGTIVPSVIKASDADGIIASRQIQNRALGWQQWVVIVVASLVGIAIGFPLFALLPLVIFLAWGAWCQARNPAHAFLLMAAAVGFLVILLADLIYIRDPFENRMNTVFKFYYQAWIILGTMAAYAVWALLQSNLRRRWFTPVWIIVALCLLIGGLVYPIKALRDGQPWYQGSWAIDGLEFLERQNPDEAEALTWIHQNTAPGAIILTAVGSSYDSETGRVASITGRPTLLGWTGSHERLWRSSSPKVLAEITARENDVPQIYTTMNRNIANQLLEKYDVDYVYVGPKERSLYSGPGLVKFDQILNRVFSQGEIQIYQRNK